MNIRAFNETDLPDIFDVYAQSKLDELRFEGQSFELLRLEDDNKRLPKIMESAIFIYEQGEDILGFGAIFESEIRALFVLPSARGQGIGKLLLRQLLSCSTSNTHLWVTCSNKPAKQLYGSYGFVVVKEFLASYNGKKVLVNEMVCHKNSKDQ